MKKGFEERFKGFLKSEGISIRPQAQCWTFKYDSGTGKYDIDLYDNPLSVPSIADFIISWRVDAYKGKEQNRQYYSMVSRITHGITRAIGWAPPEGYKEDPALIPASYMYTQEFAKYLKYYGHQIGVKSFQCLYDRLVEKGEGTVPGWTVSMLYGGEK